MTTRRQGTVSLDAFSAEDRAAGSITDQIANHLRKAIRSGRLRPGDLLPSSRELAREMGAARGTVVAVFEILSAEELLTPKPGVGVFVSQSVEQISSDDNRVVDEIVTSPAVVPEPATDSMSRAWIDFRPCRPSVLEFPRNTWKKCMSDASVKAPGPDYGDPQGIRDLRVVLSDFCRRSRGLNATPEQVFVSMGITHAVSLLARLYLQPGSKVIMEDPGYPLVRQLFESAEAEIIYCPVDSDGLVVDALPSNASDVSFVYVTPSHQFPLGGRLSSRRRRKLVQWAMDNGVIVLEDDYDGEFRYDVPPLPPLASLPNQCVIYLGTFSKTLFPDIRLGYVIASADVVQAMTRYRTIHEYGQDTTSQLALSQFVGSGHLEKHIRRMSKLYKKKRMAVQSVLRELSIPGSLTGLESGLHAVLALDSKHDAEKLSVAAASKGFLVPPVSRYQHSVRNVVNGLVVGYAAPDLTQIAEGLGCLAGLMRCGK
ncbi:MocR-like pyridoxine biosynthesis transcription factor PdxR [Aestuariispira ectoiniformans]|uniref:MocR-like pyridoxine biosynthesis transcription factor PdxR n=1 Tax=Aestuariispira ectoiniformans TaxID=2775080 RepID=UPI0040568584